MDYDGSLFPLEFHLTRVPISLQARSATKERWKSEVQEAARQRIAETAEWSWLDPEPLALALTIYYFPSTLMDGDIDNIVKPIMDALIGVAYLDDKWIERVTVQKFEFGLDWTFDTPSKQLASALSVATNLEVAIPVVYIHVANDLSWRRLS